MTRDEKLLKAVARAWNVVGANPAYHREQQKRLIRDWPVLAEAVQAVALSEKHDTRGVSGNPDSGDHLPECVVGQRPGSDIDPTRWCICERLRDCEQRVATSEAKKRVEAREQGFREGIVEGRRRSSKESSGTHKQAFGAGIERGLDLALIAVQGPNVRISNAHGTLVDRDEVLEAIRQQRAKS